MRKKVLVLGGNFGGLTAALSVKHALDGDVDVTVVSASDRFLFNPSLIWVPFGKRTEDDITFPLAPTFEAHGIEFVHATATAIAPLAKRVRTTAGTYRYDYLVIATGYRNDMAVLPGLEPANGVHTITTLQDAVEAGAGWRRFLDSPGPIVIGAAQGTGCFGVAYEFLFNTAYQLKKAGLKKRVPLTYVTAEPFLGHFGIGGLPGGECLLKLFCKKEGIQAVTGTAMAEASPGKLLLDDGGALDFAYAMMRTWRMLTAVNEELHSGIADDAAVHRAAMVFNVLRKEAISSLSPSLADEVRKLLPPLAEDSDLADTRVACASALGWLDSLMTSMLMQLAGQSEPVGGGGVRRPSRR